MASSDDRPDPGEGEPSPEDESADRPADATQGGMDALARADARARETLEATRERMRQESLDAEALVGRIEAQIGALEKRFTESAASQLGVIENSLTARVMALTDEASRRLRDEVSESLAEWKVLAREEVSTSARAALLAELEERARETKEEIARENAGAVDAALLAAQDEAARNVNRRATAVEKRLREEMAERLTSAERSVAEAAGSQGERIAAELGGKVAAEIATVRGEIAAQVDGAVAAARDRVAKKSAKRVSKLTKKAAKRLHAENEKARAKMLARVEREAALAAEVTRSALGEHVRAELRQGLAALSEEAARRHEEARLAFNETLDGDLTAASRRIAAEVRADLAGGMASAEERIEESLSVRLAKTYSALTEQAAASSAALDAKAAALAAESRDAARSAATQVAQEESRRMYGQLERRLEAQIEDRAQATLDAALARVREDGAALFRVERASFRDEAEATRAKLAELAADIERREQRRELRLAKAESSRRVKAVLAKVEAEGRRIESRSEQILAKAREELEAAAGNASAQFRNSEGEAGERLGDALRRVEATVASVEESRGRIAELERRAKAAELEATRSAELARNAYELEARMREALNLEAAAAEQIALAERRLIDFVVHR